MSTVLKRGIDAVFDRSRGPLGFVVTTASVAWMTSFALLLIAGCFSQVPRPDEPLRFGLAGLVVDNLVVPPLVENAMMFLLIGCVSPFVASRLRIVLIVAVVSGLLHTMLGGWRGIAGFISFAVMAYTTFVWADRSFGWVYRLTVLQHFLLNLPATLFVIYSDAG